jgi:hypothetical protein
MEPEDLVEQTIAWIRASTMEELRMMAHGQPQETMTSEEIIKIVDWVLWEASDALKSALNGYLDEQREQGDWWNGYGTPEHELFRGGLTKDYPLPRTPKDALQ